MEIFQLTETTLIGIALPSKTVNENGQSNMDCGNLWQKFEKEGHFKKIENKLSDEIFAVYYDYEGDHTRPFSYFIGCKVAFGTEVPVNMKSLVIPNGTFTKKVAKGKMPDCIVETWNEIWASDLPRTYKTDFEVYGQRSKNWNDAEVDIYISIHK